MLCSSKFLQRHRPTTVVKRPIKSSVPNRITTRGPAFNTSKFVKRHYATNTQEDNMVTKSLQMVQKGLEDTKQFARNSYRLFTLSREVSRDGRELTREEYQFMKMAKSDLKAFVPFFLLSLLPGSTFLLIGLIALFPGFLPSVYKSEELLMKQRMTEHRLRTWTSQWFIEHPNHWEDQPFLSAGLPTPLTQAALFFGHSMLEKEMLRKIVSPQYLQRQMEFLMLDLETDDDLLRSEGLASLTQTQLRDACLARGLNPYDRIFESGQTIEPELVESYELRNKLTEYLAFTWQHNAGTSRALYSILKYTQ